MASTRHWTTDPDGEVNIKVRLLLCLLASSVLHVASETAAARIRTLLCVVSQF